MTAVLDIHVELADKDAILAVLGRVVEGVDKGVNVREMLVGGNLLRYTLVELPDVMPAEAACDCEVECE